jgi:uncharacterized protein (TIGR00269 family)
MVGMGDKIAVAVSGGKDSSSLLYVLKRAFPDLEITGIHINLGISDYSDECERILRDFVKKLDIKLIVYDVRKELGISIEDFKYTFYKQKYCSPCGTIKRYLLNKLAYEGGFTKLATGHNLDDLVEIMLNSYLQGDVQQLVRMKPVLPPRHEKFVTKIKPLCEMTEAEDLFYAEYADIPYRTVQCPLSTGARSEERKRIIDMITREIPNFKHAFFKSNIKRILPLLELEVELPKIIECELCGMPSSISPCAFCRRIRLVKKAKKIC